MKPVTVQQMQQLDRRASSEFGISALTLMENAGKAIAELAADHFPRARNILIVCGKGNNGGDGFTAARYLAETGKTVTVFLVSNPEELKGEAKTNYERAGRVGVPFLSRFDTSKADLIVDAIFGVGLRSEVREPYLSAINQINASGIPVLSVDIPSGLNADTGEALGAAVKASVTAALALPKFGFYSAQGPALTGKIEVLDIGIPKALLQGLTP